MTNFRYIDKSGKRKKLNRHIEERKYKERPKIKFSSNYPKLWNQETAKLLWVDILDGRILHEDMIKYDTKNTKGEYYKLPKTALIQLIFQGSKGIPFSTLREYSLEKWEYYCTLIENTFDVVFPLTSDNKNLIQSDNCKYYCPKCKQKLDIKNLEVITK